MNAPLPSWPEVAAFRRAAREQCRALRAGADEGVRLRVQANVGLVVDEVLRTVGAGGTTAPCIAFYWPIRGEIGLFAAMRRAVEHGIVVGLPVVVDAEGPLVFRRWTPATRMESGVWNIPVPAASPPVSPTLLFVPVVGFDAGRHRLGNGGGYYDRTLAVSVPRPLAIGVGLECLRLPTIHPQPHDVPMDLVLTEAPPDLARVRARWPARIECASPPCGLTDFPAEGGIPER